MHTQLPSPKAGALKTIFLSTLVAGSLDISAACLYYAVILHKTSATKILQSIASGTFGKAAYEEGLRTALIGLSLHFFIAFIFAALYFFMFPRLRFLRRNTILAGVVYGIFVWLVMNVIVLPITFNLAPVFAVTNVLPGVIILIIAIGLPVSFITRAYYNRRNTSI